MNRKAFTWIELAVALAALAVLAAILFPIFARSREPRRDYCQSNLKQISLGLKQYTQDYDEHFPRTNTPPYRPGSANTFITAGTFHVTHWVYALQPYLKSIQIFQCPYESNSSGTDYYLNASVSGKDETKFKSSSLTVMLTEGTDTSMCSSAVASGPQTTGANPAPYARHRDGSNYAFIDGHVKWFHSSKAPGNAKPSTGQFTFQP